ncbi:MAG: YtxH domain-containing protein [Bacteroidota bacterium]|nr:YtxH domain-containing protein [Bacteroidota bacterium]
MSDIKFALGFIGGIAAGFIAATLVSPEKGSVLRGKIADSVTEFGECIKDSLLEMIGETAGSDNSDDMQKNSLPPVGPHAMG